MLGSFSYITSNYEVAVGLISKDCFFYGIKESKNDPEMLVYVFFIPYELKKKLSKNPEYKITTEVPKAINAKDYLNFEISKHKLSKFEDTTVSEMVAQKLRESS